MDRWVQQQEMLRNNRFSIPRMSIESSLGRRRGGGWGSAKWIIICTEEWYPQLPLSVNTCARRSVNGYGMADRLRFVLLLWPVPLSPCQPSVCLSDSAWMKAESYDRDYCYVRCRNICRWFFLALRAPLKRHLLITGVYLPHCFHVAQ